MTDLERKILKRLGFTLFCSNHECLSNRYGTIPHHHDTLGVRGNDGRETLLDHTDRFVHSLSDLNVLYRLSDAWAVEHHIVWEDSGPVTARDCHYRSIGKVVSMDHFEVRGQGYTRIEARQNAWLAALGREWWEKSHHDGFWHQPGCLAWMGISLCTCSETVKEIRNSGDG